MYKKCDQTCWLRVPLLLLQSQSDRWGSGIRCRVLVTVGARFPTTPSDATSHCAQPGEQLQGKEKSIICCGMVSYGRYLYDRYSQNWRSRGQEDLIRIIHSKKKIKKEIITAWKVWNIWSLTESSTNDWNGESRWIDEGTAPRYYPLLPLTTALIETT